VASEPFKHAPELRYHFQHDHNASRVARQILTPLRARQWGRVQDVLLAASELVTNVVHHTDDGGELFAWVGRGGSVRLEVHDRDRALPTVQETTEEGRGRGLRIVASVADEWGSAPTADGKVVWAEFRPRLSLVPDRASRE
jgi:anti-sigma regulatory factor (Ser/Thr protein kinase)